MIPRLISDIVKEAAMAQTKEDKIQILRSNLRGDALPIYLRLAIDRNIKWLIPEGAPNYTPSPHPDTEYVAYNEARRLYIFLEGGQPNLRQSRREQLFIQLLETMHPRDADFLINVVKDHKLPEGLTEKVIREAFPNL